MGEISNYWSRLYTYACVYANYVIQPDSPNEAAFENLRSLQQHWNLQQQHVEQIQAQIWQDKPLLSQLVPNVAGFQSQLSQIFVACFSGIEPSLRSPQSATLTGTEAAKPVPSERSSRRLSERSPLWLVSALCISCVVTGGLVGGFASFALFKPSGAEPLIAKTPTTPEPTPEPVPTSVEPSPSISPEPVPSKPAGPSETDALTDRCRQLGVDCRFFKKLVNETSSSQGDRAVRKTIIQTLGTTLEQFSPETRRKLGSYQPEDYDRWQQFVNNRTNLNLGKVTDQRFYDLFPEQGGKKIDQSAQPALRQVWFAIAEEEFSKIKSQSRTENRGTSVGF
jgi:hypothetical protein